MMHSNWDDLRFVLAVAETGSVNAAGKILGVNHATVLRRLAAFETRTGATLFVKSAKGYKLDPAFEPALLALKEIEANVDAFGRATHNPNSHFSGDVYLTSTDTMCNIVLPGIINAISVAYPDLRFHLAVSNSHLNLSKLDAEITIRPTMSLPPDLVGTSVGLLPFAVFAAPDYAAKHVETDPENHLWIAADGPLERATINDWQKSLSAAQIAATASSFLTMARLAETGLGACFVPQFVGEASPGLVQLPVRLKTDPPQIWVACHADLSKNPRVTAVMDLLVAPLKAWCEAQQNGVTEAIRT